MILLCTAAKSTSLNSSTERNRKETHQRDECRPHMAWIDRDFHIPSNSINRGISVNTRLLHITRLSTKMSSLFNWWNRSSSCENIRFTQKYAISCGISIYNLFHYSTAFRTNLLVHPINFNL